MDNKKLKYFTGGFDTCNWITIMGFQKNVSGSDYALFEHNPSGKHIYISYFLAFNHLTCRIERYLVNYGLPYDISNEDINSLIHNNADNYEHFSRLDNKSFNHVLIESNPHPEEAEDVELANANLASELNGLRDGKLSLNFFKIFLVQFLYSYEGLNEGSLDGIYDLRLINHLRWSNPEILRSSRLSVVQPASSQIEGNRTSSKHDLLLEAIKDISEKKEIKKWGAARPAVINIQKRFSQESFNDQICNLFGNRIVIQSFEKSEMVPCIKELKRRFTARNFDNNHELNVRIDKFNDDMARKLVS